MPNPQNTLIPYPFGNTNKRVSVSGVGYDLGGFLADGIEWWANLCDTLGGREFGVVSANTESTGNWKWGSANYGGARGAGCGREKKRQCDGQGRDETRLSAEKL